LYIKNIKKYIKIIVTIIKKDIKNYYEHFDTILLDLSILKVGTANCTRIHVRKRRNKIRRGVEFYLNRPDLSCKKCMRCMGKGFIYLLGKEKNLPQSWKDE